MSHFSTFLPSKDTAILADGNIENAQAIRIILSCFPYCIIIYPVGPDYCCLGHPYKTISLGVLKFYADFQKVASEPLENCNFGDLQGCYWRSPHLTQNNLEYLQIKKFKVNPHRYRMLVFELYVPS